jgi:hypothetical protein
MVKHHWNETQSFRHCNKQEEEEALLLKSQNWLLQSEMFYIYTSWCDSFLLTNSNNQKDK